MTRWLVLALILAAGFAFWTWLRPYDWSADTAAGFRIQSARLKRDLSYHWLDLHLTSRDGLVPDLQQPTLLVTAKGRMIAPADITMDGAWDREVRGLWLKFWLEPDDLDGPLDLKIQGAALRVRDGRRAPELKHASERVFTHLHW